MTGKLDAAIRLGREVVAKRPTMSLGHSLLAQSLLQTGRTQEALDVMLAARKQGVVSDGLLRQLGLTLSEVGRAKEAIDVLKPMVPAGDPQTLDAYALVLSEAGRQPEAAEVLQRVLAAHPGDPKAYEQLGLIALRQGRWAEARDRSRQALKLNPTLPLAWNDLGVSLFQLGAKGEALDAWQKAVDLQPDLWDALWNLGTQAAAQGRAPQARKALERFAAGAPRPLRRRHREGAGVSETSAMRIAMKTGIARGPRQARRVRCAHRNAAGAHSAPYAVSFPSSRRSFPFSFSPPARAPAAARRTFRRGRR